MKKSPKNGYIDRLAQSELSRKLDSSGCVLVTGPKFCGKSTMCEQFCKSKTELKKTNDILLALADPVSTLKGEKPHLIDEWQKAPEIWNVIKDDLDKDYQFGKYILTGSTTPVNEKKIQHSGAGRISTLLLKPFTLFESGESKGIISLKDLFNNKKIDTYFSNENDINLEDIAYYICRGGWPISLKAKKRSALDTTEDYYNGLFKIENENDDFALFLKNKNIDLLKLILKSYARNISTQCKKTKMIKDILASESRESLSEETFDSYVKTLKDLFIIYDLPAWNLNLRSSVAIRTAPTHHFIDTSIATASLGITPSNLMNDLKSFGYFFEDFALRDLSVYAQASKAKLKHYRDSSGQEIDAVIEMPNGEYGIIEIKISSEDNINKGIKSLNSFENKMKRSKLKTPVFKMILTSHGSCYKTKDNIYIVPINFLKD